MEKMISKLFSDYLSEQNIASKSDYSALAKSALQKEKELRNELNEEQTKLFEELFELTSQIHFLEVKDAFYTWGKSIKGVCYLISCWSFLYSGVSKNSIIVISRPSQIFLRVTMPGFLLSPFKMLLIVD